MQSSFPPNLSRIMKSKFKISNLSCYRATHILMNTKSALQCLIEWYQIHPFPGASFVLYSLFGKHSSSGVTTIECTLWSIQASYCDCLKPMKFKLCAFKQAFFNLKYRSRFELKNSCVFLSGKSSPSGMGFAFHIRPIPTVLDWSVTIVCSCSYTYSY